MTHAMTAGLALMLALGGLTACKIVPDPDPETTAAPMDDAQRMAQLAGQIFDDKLVPFVAEHAVDTATSKSALAGGLDAAGTAHGVRPGSEGSPWNFLLADQGSVVAADRESRAANMVLDTDGDGQGDVTVQLGPVIRGTSLRDAADFLVFTDFRDQIEFAKLARALNDAAFERITLPEGDLTGMIFQFQGAATLRSAGDDIVIVPTMLQQVTP